MRAARRLCGDWPAAGAAAPATPPGIATAAPTSCARMFAAVGVVGLAALQAAAAFRKSLSERQRHAAQPQVGDVVVAAAAARPLSHVLRHGALVVLRDQRGQLAVAQPQGVGRVWELVPNCAPGGALVLTHGVAKLSYVTADALFRVCQLPGTPTHSFALHSLGASGRSLAATRELGEPPLLQDCRAATPAALWRAAGGSLVNVAHAHKRLQYTLHDAHVVPLDAVSAAERAYEALLAKERAQACAAEDDAARLDAQLQGARAQLAAVSQEHADTVESLVRQLSEAQQARHTLELQAHAACERARCLQAAEAQARAAHRASEMELGAAHAEVARLQAALDDAQPGVAAAVAAAAAAQQRHRAAECLRHDMHAVRATELEAELQAQQRRHADELQQLAAARRALEAGLRAKDAETHALAAQVERLEAGLEAVERLMRSSARMQRLDRASLDAVSVHQLQAAVAQFVLGEAPDPAPDPSSLRESVALRSLLLEGGGSGANSGAGDAEAAPMSCTQSGGAEPVAAPPHTQAAAVPDSGRCADQSPDRSRRALSSSAGGSANQLHDTPLLKLAASSGASTKQLVARGNSLPGHPPLARRSRLSAGPEPAEPAGVPAGVAPAPRALGVHSSQRASANSGSWSCSSSKQQHRYSSCSEELDSDEDAAHALGKCGEHAAGQLQGRSAEAARDAAPMGGDR